MIIKKERINIRTETYRDLEEDIATICNCKK